MLSVGYGLTSMLSVCTTDTFAPSVLHWVSIQIPTRNFIDMRCDGLACLDRYSWKATG